MWGPAVRPSHVTLIRLSLSFPPLRGCEGGVGSWTSLCRMEPRQRACGLRCPAACPRAREAPLCRNSSRHASEREVATPPRPPAMNHGLPCPPSHASSSLGTPRGTAERGKAPEGGTEPSPRPAGVRQPRPIAPCASRAYGFCGNQG